jgi:hypothetical protein
MEAIQRRLQSNMTVPPRLPPLILACFIWLIAATAGAQIRDRAATDGLSVGVGIGHASAGLGGRVHYYFQLSERWRLAVHGAVGINGYASSDGEADARVGAGGGVMAAFGRRHRLIIDVLAAPFQADAVIGERMALYYGVGTLVGWEWMARYGLAVRAGLGVQYCPARDGGSIGPAIDLVSLDYKFW